MKSLLPGVRVISFSLSCYFNGFVVYFDDVYTVGKTIKRNDGLVACDDRRETYCLSVESEGTHLVAGAVYNDAITFEGKLVVRFYLFDTGGCSIGEGRNLPQFVTGCRGS